MKESEQPEWQELMRSDPFGEPTFTMALIRRIEERARRGDREQSPIKRYYLAGSAAVLAIVIAAGIGFSAGVPPFASNLPGGSGPNALPSISPTASASASATASPGPSAGPHLYSLKSEVEVLEQPEAYTTIPSLFVANPGPYYMLKERKNGFVQVTNTISSNSNATGWIPEWYLRADESSSQAEKVDPYQMIVESPAAFRLYPEEPQPSGFELEPGKVVQVTARYGDWMRVNIMTYDSPYVGDKWVPASALEAWDSAKAMEGVLRPGAVVYDHDGKAKDSPPALNPIKIEEESSGRYRIGAPGGYVGFIDKTDFIPGPFLKIVDQSDEVPVGGQSEDEEIEQSTQDKWLVRESEREAYEAYRNKPSDDLLQGLAPMDVFRYYVTASRDGDFETAYDLLIHDPERGTPDREDYVSDIAHDSGLAERTKRVWDGYMQRFDKLEQRMDGEQAVIAMIDSGGKEPELQFRMVRDAAGVWKVDWLALQ